MDVPDHMLEMNGNSTKSMLFPPQTHADNKIRPNVQNNNYFKETIARSINKNKG